MTSTSLDEKLVDQSISSDSSDECPFNAEISSKLSAAFAKATGIDMEFAIQLLKDHAWNIDQALRATYEAKEYAQSMINTKENWKTCEDQYLKIFSWNTDTADSDEIEMNDLIEQRAETMVEIFLREKPDVILLQKVGTLALTLIITSLSSFYDDESVQIDSPVNCNYVSIFTRKATIKKNNVSIIQNSEQWKMLKIEVEYRNSTKFDLFNAYIDENTSSFCFEQIDQNRADRSILSGISSQMSDENWNSQAINLDDLWEKTSQTPETAYTFDPELNSNIHSKDGPQRFDRLYFRSFDEQLKAIHMELEGIRHLKTSDHLFPSTHWAIQGYFQIDNSHGEDLPK